MDSPMSKAYIPTQVVLVDRVVQVSADFGCRGVELGPVRIWLPGKLIGVCRNIAGAAL